MDAITMLKQQHKEVQQLFREFEQQAKRDPHAKGLRSIADQVIEQLSAHAALEEQVFYPVTRAEVPATEDIALESLEEHHIVKWVLSELDGLDPGDERFVPKMTVLIENVRHHVEEEESEYFPMVREALGRKRLQEVGEQMQALEPLAPSHPHPRAPDTPPGNLAAGVAAGVVDKARDLVGRR